MNSVSRKVKADIERVGWSLISVGPDGKSPGFSYTVGLWKTFNHREIIIFGLPPGVTHGLCNIIVEKIIRKGDSVAPGKAYDEIAAGFDTRFIRVDETARDAHMFLLKLCYDAPHKVPVIQLVWPDPGNKFPWEAGFDHTYDLAQPLLGPVPLVH